MVTDFYDADCDKGQGKNFERLGDPLSILHKTVFVIFKRTLQSEKNQNLRLRFLQPNNRQVHS